ncbi:MAG: Uma2 family endonuclease [Selenomonadaceae bacterium]|nr:Uma2 family endonuclease [Selenomonadaceae bacterium]
MPAALAIAIEDEDYCREEVIDGEYMMAPAPGEGHNSVMTNILVMFSNYLKGKPCRAYGDNIDVFLDENNRFQPDVSIVCDRSKIKANGIHGAPDLVVEILSLSTAKNDRGKKFKAYERFGVKEYWIVDTVTRRVEVYHNSPEGFVLDNVYAVKDPVLDFDVEKPPTEIKVSLYEDLIVDVKDIFYDMMW